MKLQPQDKAPHFSLPNADDINIALQDLLSHNVVLYFYPRDNTPGCTTEAEEFSALIDAFKAKNTIIVGISPDSTKSHKGFIAKKGLKIILLSDVDKSVATAYGTYGSKMMYGKEVKGIIRSTFVIDTSGTITHSFYNVKAKGHAKKVLEAL